jgi:uncharacterized protein
MTKEQIDNLLANGQFPENAGQRELIETHISWVILCGQFVYKIKKAVQYSFLDFSTLALRKHFCHREIELNKRLSGNIYIDVQPVYEWNGSYRIGGKEGMIKDYAVRMYKMDREKQMDVLLTQHKVSWPDIRNLAEKVAVFHKKTNIIYQKDFLEIQEMFNDLGAKKNFPAGQPDSKRADIINRAIETSDNFIKGNIELLAARLGAGFFRDCHGDLHSRNIFLLPSPEPFDCIEFNDDLRQVDVLNEVAFLSMDLDAFGRQDLSELFIKYYNQFFPAIKGAADRNLFIYYKSYRSNVRAKVNYLRAKSAANDAEKMKALSAADKYIDLMDSYLKSPHLLP